MLTFGERLRMARERKGLSQLDVYKAINLNNKSLSRYENNATAPDPETVKALVQLYDVSADFILGLSDDMGNVCPPSGTSKSKPKAADAISSGDAELIKKIEGLSPEAKEKAADYLEMLKTLQEVKSGDTFVDFKEKA
ncbi:MAG: helix-turn-helix transcriptional regulator [Oscillospiraceae bacterium]|nr:helix-turn-helix transcriptional regulator [Oscillospiraceae bacterium]